MSKFPGKKRDQQPARARAAAPPRDEPPHPADEPQRPAAGQKSTRSWFTADQLPAQHGVEMDICILKPIRVYTGGKFGDKLIVGIVTDQEAEHDWSVKIGGQQFMRLEKRLGKDLTEWPGQVVPVTRGHYNGSDYVEVVE